VTWLAEGAVPECRHRRSGARWEARRCTAGGRSSRASTAEGVDANASKEHLQGVARRLDVRGRSTIKKANRRATAKSR